MMILAADIGGTKSLFALCRMVDSKPEIIAEKRYPSKTLGALEEAAATFLADSAADPSALESACFSLAGPIINDSCKLTNLDLVVSLKSVGKALSFIPRIKFCNDLEALGHGIALLSAQDLQELTPGNGPRHLQAHTTGRESGKQAVIAPGTGLGEAFIIDGKVYPSEGAHCEFGPRTEQEVRLWRFLHRQFGHVSYERILSGPGLQNIYRFLREDLSPEPSSADLPVDPTAEEISSNALQRSCPLCQQALRLFTSILGAEAGNLALKTLASEGIYLGGGIPPQILPSLTDGTFLSAFRAKGRFSYLLEQVPVYVILNERTALYGAALLAGALIAHG